MRLTQSLTWPFLALTFATLMVYLGGLAALQSSCYGGGLQLPPTAGVTGTGAGAAFGLSASPGVCGRVFRFHWFSFAFVAATLIGMMIAAASLKGLHYSRPFWIGMLAVSTILMMIMSETFVGMHYLYEGAGQITNRMRTVTAGAIMTVVGLVLLMLAIGTDWEHRRGAIPVDEKPMTGVTTGTTTAPMGGAVPVQNVRVAEQV